MIEGEQLPTVNAERVALRWLVEEDVPALFDIFSHPEVMEFWSTTPFEDIAKAHDLLREIREGFENRTFFQWGLVKRDDETLIGTCTLFQLDASNRRAEVGYVLGREHWGNGYMSEAVDALIRFGFEDLDLTRLEADVDPDNAGSIRLLENKGFLKEGYMRDRWRVGGKVMDSVFYGLLRREWQAK